MNRLVCGTCSESYDIYEPRWRCECGGLLDIEFEARFDPGADGSTLWRYGGAIPVKESRETVTLGEGMTPLREYHLAGRTVLVKEEYVNPTGSFKDRGASVLATRLREAGITEVVEDSSGNAGAALAAYCSEAGVRCTVFVPESVRTEKAERIRTYGGHLVRVPGSREECARAAIKAARKTYYASHSRNPFFLQGTKTFAYEVCEQLEWNPPDALVLPVGNGTLLLGAYIGFKDMINAGLIDRVPRLIGVQAKACAPLFQAFHSDGRLDGSRLEAGPGDTMADGIAIASPARGEQILDAVRSTGGNFFAVDDPEIIAALRDVAGKGFQIEPTAAATLAGLARYLARGEGDEVIVTAFTGNNSSPARY